MLRVSATPGALMKVNDNKKNIMSISLNYYLFEPKINSRSFYLDWYNDNKKNILCQFTIELSGLVRTKIGATPPRFFGKN